MRALELWNYLTIDVVNAAAAEQLAAKYSLSLEVVEPRDLPRLERDRARLIVDWDCTTDADRAKLLSSMALSIIAIHGYHLDEALAGFLPRRGIYCGRRLDERLFQALADAASAA